MRSLVPLLATLAFALPPAPARADAISTAFNDAMAAFDAARAGLPPELAGVDVVAYGQALSSGQFASPHWGETVTLDLHESTDDGGSCGRFAAYVHLPPRNGTVRLTLAHVGAPGPGRDWPLERIRVLLPINSPCAWLGEPAPAPVPALIVPPA